MMRRHSRKSALSWWGVAGVACAAALLWRKRPGLSLRGRVAVITGGSRGLGLALARELGRQGVVLALVARDEAELAAAAAELRERGWPVTTWTCDLTNVDEISVLVENVIARHDRIDVLVNNAGEIVTGPFETFTPEDFEREMAIHLWAPLRLIQSVTPWMKHQGIGRIVNISSIGGKVPVPHLSAYCASKFALAGLSATLRAELAKDGIAVTTVCPGLMRTGSHWNAWFKGDHEREFAWFAHAASMPGTSISAARAARQIVAAMRRGDAELVITIQARAAALAWALVPGWVSAIETFVNRFLPAAPRWNGHAPKTGWDSCSKWAPSLFTHLGDRAAERHNELRGHPAPARDRFGKK
jgi:NAD(P)-dependent dehydrogenase (short-subunit alcohol dehydrogenase family)